MIQRLVLGYAKLVEHLDLNKDPMKYYFLEKIQYVLSRPFALLSLTQKPSDVNKVAHHRHNFSLPVLKFENQSIV